MWQLFLWNDKKKDYDAAGEPTDWAAAYRAWSKMANGGCRQRLRRYAIGRA